VDLARFVHVLRLYWWIVVVTVVACVGAGALIVSLESPRYTASTQLFVSTPSAPGNLSSTYQGGLFSQQRVLSYSHVVSSPLVMREVIAHLALPMSVKDLQREITATVPVDTVLIDVSVVDRSPTRAAAIANAIGADFPGLAQSLETIPGRQAPVKVTVTSSATVPTSPSSPRKKLDLVIAAFVGLALGIGITSLRWFFDTRIRSAADATSLADTPVLGRIPRHASRGRKRPLVATDALSPAGEAYRRLRTNLRVRPAHGEHNAVVVTSALPDEGTTSIVANLGIAFSQAGYSVALLDANLRNPGLAAVLGLSATPGLTNVLVDGMPIESAIQRWSGGGASVSLLASGPVPGNPSELLDSLGFISALRELERTHDVVIIDSPALLPVIDAAIIAQSTSQALLVARFGSTRTAQLDAAVEHLRAVDAHIVGVVLNRSR
jgi:succinoglycan biosynthesis transport protein ExoP